MRNIERLTLLRPSIKKQPENNIQTHHQLQSKKPQPPTDIEKKIEGLLLMTRKPAIKPENIQIT